VAEGFKIADGYLDIEADVDHALKDVRRFFKEIDGELSAEEQAFKKSGEKSGKTYAESIERSAKIDTTFRRLTGRALDAAQGESSRRGGLLGALMGGGGRDHRLRDLLPNRSVFARMFSGLKAGGRALMSGLGDLFSGGASLFKGITKGITEAFSTGLDQAQQLWKSASKAFEQIGSIGSGVGSVVQFAAMGIAVPLVLGLAGALLHLSAALLALPAAAAVAVAAIAPLIVAFKGFGEAVSAGLSGDTEKFNEALKKLSPSARSVAKDVVALGPAFSKLRKVVQESLFSQLVGQLSKLGTTLLPALTVGMSSVAGALGHLLKLFVGLMSTPDTINMINNLFATTTRIIDTMAEPLINLFGGLFDLINAGLPWVEKFTHVLANGLQAAADWLQKISAPGGKFTSWMERAWNVGKQLWEVLKNLGAVAFTMLDAFGDEGTDTLTGMADALRKMNEYLHSAEGAETLHNLGVIVHWAGNAFVFFLGTLVNAWKGLNAVFSFVRGIGPFFSGLWDDIVGGVKAVGHWFADLGRTIWGGITTAWNAVAGFGQAIWNALTIAYNAVVGAGKAVIDWFVALPGVVGGFIMSLPGMIGSAMANVAATIQYGLGYLAGLMVRFWTVDLPGWFRSAWESAKNFTITGMMAIMGWLNALPGQISSGLSQLGDAIGGWFSRAWAWAQEATITGMMAVIAWANSLPGRISSAFSRLMDAIGGWFSRTWDQAKNSTLNGMMAVMGWINSIPGAVGRALSGAGHWLYDAGRDILHGLVNGIADTLSWAVNAARDAASRIKRGFLDALGIASPSQVMRMEVGRWILPGVMQGIKDTEPRFDDYLGASADRIRGGFQPVVNVAAPNVSVGGTTLLVDLGDGIRQAVPVQIMRNPQVVASAANVGNRQRAAWTNTGRPVITGTGG